MRRSGIDRVGSSPAPGDVGANSIEQCPNLVAKTDGGSRSLFNMPAANGRVLYTVLPGTVLSRFPQNGAGTAEFPQVSFVNAEGATIGGKNDAQSLFISRNDISCAPAGTPTLAGATSGSGQRDSNAGGAASQPTAKPALSQTGAQASPPTSTCKVDVPWAQKALLWIKPECTLRDGKKITLERQASVTVRQSAEPGSPTRFLETTKNCTILVDNIDRATCAPKLPALNP